VSLGGECYVEAK